MAQPRTVSGKDLQVGDSITCWWGVDTITGLRPYSGRLAKAFPAGARIASFARNQSGMTINNDDDFSVVASMRVSA